MQLPEIAAEVQRVFDRLDADIAAFQSATTLHCRAGCGKCCFKPDIEATVLEFLPFALHLYKEGLAYEWLERLEQEDGSICMILNPTQSGTGLCSQYQHRGMICRLFGYSARTNKYAKKELVTCEIIKTEQASAYSEAVRQTEEGNGAPVMNEYYMQLVAVDPELSRDFFRINEAIRRAIGTVLHYYAYR